MSAIAKNQVFSAVHTVGGLLPADMLVRISEGKDVAGAKPADYGVVGVRSVSDDAERHWSFLKGIWKDLRTRLEPAPDAQPPEDLTGMALPQWVEPLFNELGFGRLPKAPTGGLEADDGTKAFPVSHLWQHVPIHVVAWQSDLDRRPSGTGSVPPQSLVQESLNRTSSHLWAVLTNGRQLRLLRDSSAMATASYVEFDLEAIFDGELFSEFVLLYRLLHASRFEVAVDAAPSACWLEKWRADAIESGTRALDQLRKGVQAAITTLGSGFLRHPDNAVLRSDLDVTAFHGALLRLVYRMLFLFVAEDRGALHPPKADPVAKERYAKYFSTARLRRYARRRRGTAHGDQYATLRIVLDALQREDGRPQLALVGLGGLFDDKAADAPLDGLKLSNDALLGAVRQLAQVRDTSTGRWRAIDYRNLDAEELGSIYESLLELVPKHSESERTFELIELAGNDRKTTGSYYTPSSLIETLLDSALDPVITDAIKRGQEKATRDGQPDSSETVAEELLSLTICDPACGSGHFLVAAARRIAKQVASVREHNPEPTVDAVRSAMHEVVARCIYGVDLNPMAVDLAKVSLWLESLEPGKPLNFLDAHVKHGNALMGATPALLKDGVPDDAFKPIEGDDRKYASFLAKTNKEERKGQVGLFDIDDVSVKVDNAELARGLRRVTADLAGDLGEVRRQEAEYQAWAESDTAVRRRRAADAWCAALVWRKTKDAPRAVTNEVFRNITNAEGDGYGAPYGTVEEIDRLRKQYRFFHWHLEFPNIFRVPNNGFGFDDLTGWTGGFDCVAGNPPWESIAFDDEEYFSHIAPELLSAGTTNKRKMGIQSEIERGAHWKDDYFRTIREKAELSKFFSSLGHYSLTARGRIKTQSLFASMSLMLAENKGTVGVIVPTGVVTDVPMKDFWEYLRDAGYIRGIMDFDNKNGIFPAIHKSTKFMILALRRQKSDESSTYLKIAVYLRTQSELSDPQRVYSLPLSALKVLNPATGQLPICLTRRDFDLLLAMTVHAQARSPIRITPWVGFTSEGFSKHFQYEESPGSIGLLEGKMIHQFDARFADYANGNIAKTLPDDKGARSRSRHYCDHRVVDKFLDDKEVTFDWVAVVRDYVRAVDSRTAIATVAARTAPIQPLNGWSAGGGADGHAWALAIINSFAYDFMAKQKTPGQHFNVTIMGQIPIPGIVGHYMPFVRDRVLELSYIAPEIRGFARNLGDKKEAFAWKENRRFIIRAELDAFCFHLYGISRDDVSYIMESFVVVKRQEENNYGYYRTKDIILENYDRMAAASISLDVPAVDGDNFTSTLTPPPGHGPRHEPA